jgi:hypothetical protein
MALRPAYRAHVDDALRPLSDCGRMEEAAVAKKLELGIAHEMRHQELILTVPEPGASPHDRRSGLTFRHDRRVARNQCAVEGIGDQLAGLLASVKRDERAEARTPALAEQH